ncbi:MAG TPA: ribonuclease P protein component [Candidatus Paceibacterota bacterium]|nr:ribonuclease P protein component [Candidatus Paceibacterota bacterium]
MFPRSLRLGRQGIEQSRKLHRVSTAHFSISYGNSTESAGLGVIVPKKAVRGAVGRHRLKRLLREILREIAKTPGIPTTIVVAARSGSDSLTFTQIQHELSEAFKAILAKT